ncbi:hypothetical protein CC86DRAFT_436897 [Ophiobolus disseminans]|uniref:lytic cellulose monooxygenase (C4-dehydrogenating) n=1 Tax=Ophiobolus disseminans TaxID=1469910 RepID=A0A6A7A928_9PLEO|nr:hypothetical protein CC86DRAFT_436897 [Ophiobolus disseminans]
MLLTVQAHCTPIPQSTLPKTIPPNPPPDFFDRLLVNNTWSQPWEYIRPISPSTPVPSPTDYDYITPLTDPSSPILRCGRTTSPYNTNTAIIQAGSTVGFTVNTTVGLPIPNAPQMPWDLYPNLYHPGPASAWLSRVPASSSLDTYAGEGDWFKIHSAVRRTPQSVPPTDAYVWKHQWATYQATNWTFSIPASTPSGEYLLRFEHIYPLPVESLQGAQFYVNCAQVRIVGDGRGVPGPVVGIPGVYEFGQKGMCVCGGGREWDFADLVYAEIYFYADVGNETYDIGDFVEPAPAVWLG